MTNPAATDPAVKKNTTAQHIMTEPVIQPVEAEVQSSKLTFEDLKASVGKGPTLTAKDIANTYYSDREFLDAIAAEHGSTSASPYILE